MGLTVAPAIPQDHSLRAVRVILLMESKKESVQTHLDAFFPLRVTGTAQYRSLISLRIVEAIDSGSCFGFR